MTIDNEYKNFRGRGCIEVICGSMFSGKTEELIRRLKRANYAKLKVAIFKPALDNRYHEQMVISHDSNKIESIPVNASQEIIRAAMEADVVGIDEAQFFDEGLTPVCLQLANNGVRVIVAGLDMDYTGKPFGPIPELLAVAEYVTKVHAICVRCGDLASHSHRLSKNNELILLGETDSYEPLCRACFNRVSQKD